MLNHREMTRTYTYRCECGQMQFAKVGLIIRMLVKYEFPLLTILAALLHMEAGLSESEI